MATTRHTLGRFRPWTGPAAALALSLVLAVLPLPTKEGIAGTLERTVFLPFRFALGWGPRSLVAQRQAAAQYREQAERAREEDELLEAARENDRLRSLLGFRRRGEYDLIPATVLARGRARFGDLLVVAPERLPVDDPTGLVAITPEGLLGRIASRDGSALRLECLTNGNVAVSVLNQRSREGGILRWDPVSGGLIVEGVPLQSDWQPGDRIITSGLGTAFPRGILVGWVRGLRGAGSVQTVAVRAAAAAGRTQEVFLLGPSLPMDEAGNPWVPGLYPPESPPAARPPSATSAGAPPGTAGGAAPAANAAGAAAAPEPVF